MAIRDISVPNREPVCLGPPLPPRTDLASSPHQRSLHQVLRRLHRRPRQNDKPGQAKAVANLTRYTKEHGAFLAKATGLPKLAVQNDLLGHVLELKNQLDSYASGNHGKATGFYRQAYSHMFMTGDLLSGAIAKQKNLR